MMQAYQVLEELNRVGFRLFSGVPCSFLAPLINAVIDSPETQYIGAANEGDALAIACGAELGGVHGAVLLQNSGLGNAVNPLTSLAMTFKIPVLMITSLRGQPAGAADEPQHEIMGMITSNLFDLMGIPWCEFPESREELALILEQAIFHMKTQKTPLALIVKKGTIKPQPLQARPEPKLGFRNGSASSCGFLNEPFDQDDVLSTIQSSVNETDAILTTTGYTGRALYAIKDKPNQLYMVGSMGCVSSLGLGLAAVRPRKRTVVIDGDGALLMRMGALATIGYQQPQNFLHILLDNGAHDSTGSQATVSPYVDLAGVAKACGYRNVVRLDDLAELEPIIQTENKALTFIQIKTKSRTNRKLPRPELTPVEVAARFRRWLENN